MKTKLKGIYGNYAVGECGFADIENLSNAEEIVSNKVYPKFEKKELFWAIYDRIICPTRKKIVDGPDHSLRLFYIEEDEDNLILNFNLDDFGEASYEIEDAMNLEMDDILNILFESLQDTFPDDPGMKNAITYDSLADIVIPRDYLERVQKEVLYSMWEIDSIKE